MRAYFGLLFFAPALPRALAFDFGSWRLLAPDSRLASHAAECFVFFAFLIGVGLASSASACARASAAEASDSSPSCTSSCTSGASSSAVVSARPPPLGAAAANSVAASAAGASAESSHLQIVLGQLVMLTPHVVRHQLSVAVGERLTQSNLDFDAAAAAAAMAAGAAACSATWGARVASSSGVSVAAS